MKEIPLPRGQVALIDDSDLELVSQFTWSITRSGRNFYATWSRKGRGTLCMHRLIMGVTERRLTVDHIDGNGLNNCRSNLRVCTQKENLWNQTRTRGASKYRGVNFRKDTKSNPWHAKITVDGVLRHLGAYPTEIDAAKAYDQAARMLRGNFAALNFPDLVAEYDQFHPLSKKAVG